MIAKTMRSCTPTRSGSVMASSWGSEDLSMWIHRERDLADAFADSVAIHNHGDHNNDPFASWCERARHHEWLLRDNRDEAASSDKGLQMWLHTKPQQKEEKEQRASDPKLSAMVANAQELEMWLTPKERQSTLSDDLAQWLAAKDNNRDEKSVMQSGRDEDSASSIVVIDHDDFVMAEDTMDCDQDREDLGFWLL